MPVDVAADFEYAEVIFGNLLANASDFSAGKAECPSGQARRVASTRSA